MQQTDLIRWTKPESYLGDWQERSERMIGLLDEKVRNTANLSFTEYGCGPNAPISKILNRSGRVCKRYDIKAWDSECSVVDLNESDFSVQASDVAVMSGVAEYMNNLGGTLKLLSASHKYLLMSYHPFGQRKLFSIHDPIKEINKRSGKSGWRNHLTLTEILQVIASVAYPLYIEKYRAQHLMLWRFHN